MSRLRGIPVLLAVGVALGLPVAAAAQRPAAKPAPRPAAGSDRCVFQIDNVDRQGAVEETPRGTNYYAGGNVRLSCRGTQIAMQSDSVAAYGGSVVQFIGHVKYRDSTLTMDADRGTYYKDGERWAARGHVNTQNLANGSTLTGPSLDYFRVVPGVRDTLEMYAVGRPNLKYVEAAQGQGEPAAEPYLIVADRVRFKGNDRIFAGGKVTIDRSDFAARSDSMRLDTGVGSDGTLIGGEPIMRGLGTDSFRLSGTRIDLALKQRQLDRVVAKGARTPSAATGTWWPTPSPSTSRTVRSSAPWPGARRPVPTRSRRATPCAPTRSCWSRRGSCSRKCADTARPGWAGRWTR